MLFTTYFFLSLTHALMTGTKEQSIFLHQSRFSWFYSYFLPRKSKNPSWLTPYAFLFVVQKVLFLLFKHPTMVVSKQRALPRKIFAKDYTGGFGAIGFVIFLDWCAMFLIRVATWKNCLAVVKVWTTIAFFSCFKEGSRALSGEENALMHKNDHPDRKPLTFSFWRPAA